MNDLEIVKVTNPEGKEEEIKVITILKKTDTDEKFVLYTYDSDADDVDVYASVLKEEEDGLLMDAITKKEDWELVQKAIKELSE